MDELPELSTRVQRESVLDRLEVRASPVDKISAERLGLDLESRKDILTQLANLGKCVSYVWKRLMRQDVQKHRDERKL